MIHEKKWLWFDQRMDDFEKKIKSTGKQLKETDADILLLHTKACCLEAIKRIYKQLN
jgi:hypothetical protein